MNKVLILLNENAWLTLHMDKTKLPNDCLRMRRYGKNLFIEYSVDCIRVICQILNHKQTKRNDKLHREGVFPKVYSHNRRFDEKILYSKTLLAR